MVAAARRPRKASPWRSPTARPIDTVFRIVLTEEPLLAPDPELEEQLSGKPNTHQTALRILADHLTREIVTDAPRIYSWLARLIEGVRSVCDRLLTRLCGSAKPRDDVAHLDAAIGDETLPKARCDHAVQTLALITGRPYHREKNGRAHAKAWLSRHASASTTLRRRGRLR
jgi:hypothetical protein